MSKRSQEERKTGQSIELSSELILNQADVWKIAQAIFTEIISLLKKSV